MKTLLIGLIAICMACVVFLIIATIKLEIVYRGHRKLIDAIYHYQMDLIESDRAKDISVEFRDIIDLEEAFNNPFVWSAEQMLPKGKYEIIKPYIGKEV